MLYNLVVLSALVSYTFAAPLSSCEAQAECIDASITEADTDDDGNAQYEICLIFDATLDACAKDESDEISHACVAGIDGIVSEEDGEKIEGLSTGDGDSLCDTVSCGSYTTFGLKDGRSCELDGDYLYANLSIPDYDELLYCYSGMSCNANGKNDKACKWSIKAPDCEEQCPEALDSGAAGGDDCDFGDAVCPYGEQECCGETMEQYFCQCEYGTTVCDVVDCAPDSLCETYPDPEPCDCTATLTAEEADLEELENAREVECTSRCDGDVCRYMGEGNCAYITPPSSAAMYTRDRMDGTELETIDTNTDGSDTTDTDGTDGTVSEKTSKAGVINLSIVSIVSTVLYLLQ